MISEGERALSKDTQNDGTVWRAYVLIGVLGIVILGSMGYVLWSADHMIAKQWPMVSAAKEIRLEATNAHLWFEEIISGDRYEDIDVVMEHIDKADWYGKVMLEGGESSEGLFSPLRDETLQRNIIEVREKIANFKQITKERWANRETSGIGSEIDQKYDEVFRDFIAQAERVEADLQKALGHQLKNFQILQVTLILACIVVTIITGGAIGKLMGQHIRDKVLVEIANQELKASNQQLEASEQQLVAANQQLRANEQQLVAANQQLRANEQQLVAANQQLRANEQQLVAANQQLRAGEQQLLASNQQLRASEQQLMAANQQLRAGEQQLMAANQQLRANEESLEILARFPSENPHPVMRISAGGAILYSNEASEAIGELCGNKETQRISDHWHEYVQSALSDGMYREAEFECDSRVWVLTFAPVEKLDYVNLYAMDITRRKQIEQERENILQTLKAKNKELQSVVYITSHDLRSPLVNIQGFGGELGEGCKQLDELLDKSSRTKGDEETIKKLLKKDIPDSLNFIRSGIRKMHTLLEGLLEVSRVGTSSVKITTLRINEMVHRLVESMQFEAKESGTTIIVDDLPNCLGDIIKTNQVFANLLDNALKYIDPDRKGRIHVSGSVDNGMSTYCVEDNGIGIANDHKDKIFEVFHRLDPNDSAGGEGLGLAVVLRIVGRLNGRVWVESEEGKGSKFFVSLPHA